MTSNKPPESSKKNFPFDYQCEKRRRRTLMRPPSHYILGSFMPAELALAFTLVWKHQDCPLSAIHSIYRRVINPSGKDCESAVQEPGLFTKKGHFLICSSFFSSALLNWNKNWRQNVLITRCRFPEWGRHSPHQKPSTPWRDTRYMSTITKG